MEEDYLEDLSDEEREALGLDPEGASDWYRPEEVSWDAEIEED